MKNTPKGFTLIELVIVIVILGILAAFAIPRFVDLGSSAKQSAINTMAGSIRSAVTLAHSQWLASGSTGSTVVIDGTTIDLENYYPSNESIMNMIADTSGYIIDVESNFITTFTRSDARIPSECQILYTQATSTTTPPTIMVDSDGC
jgi:MSHA pilin protein MshA